MIGFISENMQVSSKLKQVINEWILLPALGTLHKSVESHADMLCCTVGQKVIMEPTIRKRVLEKHPDLSSFVIAGQTQLQEKYPYNIAYNVAFIGNYALHHTKYTDSVLKGYIDALGYEWIHTNQGYSNCMCLSIGNSGAITSDRGLHKTLSDYGLDVLLIDAGYIELPGLNYGFIGGAAFTVRDTVYFTGGLQAHPDGNRIKTFIERHGLKVCELTEKELIDIGSGRFISP